VVLLAAVLADSINLKGMPRGDIVIFVADLLLDLANFLRKKFD
jgi:hypothetical protein